MKRMWSRNELKNLANAQVQEQVSGGQLENVKVFEEIVDKDGHKRFIEGDIEIEEISGVTKTFGKWALSGTHLMIVLACDFENALTLSAGILAYINLPKWIKDKIKPLYSGVISSKLQYFYNTDFSSQTTTCYLRKTGAEQLLNIYLDNITFTKSRSARIEFDLIIDTE